MDDAVWDHSTFRINRDRWLENDVITDLFEEVVNLARKQTLLSEEPFRVDGTLIQARASQKSDRRKDDDREPLRALVVTATLISVGKSAVTPRTSPRQRVMP